jgi:transcriptional regulator with XRE-family HTH domain
MLTDFGKLVRKHRIDAGMRLRAMAESLGVSAAFLSAMETGRKPVPAETAKRIADILSLDLEERSQLLSAAEASRAEFKIRPGKGAGQLDREVAAMFARQFPTLSKEALASIKRILEETE